MEFVSGIKERDERAGIGEDQRRCFFRSASRTPFRTAVEGNEE
jgi:hypothetical protein